ncbi:hypothetical protein B5M09_012057, partial [Aphanomyces astaci]
MSPKHETMPTQPDVGDVDPLSQSPRSNDDNSDTEQLADPPKVTPATDLYADAMAELKQLKLMLLEQKQEIDDLRDQPTESSKPKGLWAVESEGKDLLRKWQLISLPDSGPDNYKSFINHLKPTPGHAVKRKALTSALLNEEEKRRERKRGNRHDERHDRPRDAERQRKRTYEAKGIEDMTLEINALQTRLTELSDKRRKTDDGLLWCYICKKKGDHEAKGHPNYVNKRAAERINATTLATDKALDPPSDAKLRHWHNKLNHTDMRQMAKIIQPILLPGINSSTTNHICDGCAQGQAKRVLLRNTHHYVPTDPLECLNGDLCGPVKPRTVNHESFTSMFIDKASRYIFGKLLKAKDATILHLDALVSDLNSQLPHTRVRMLHTDGVGSTQAPRSKLPAIARGIRQKFTNVETPEENHLAEKANEFVFKIR